MSKLQEIITFFSSLILFYSMNFLIFQGYSWVESFKNSVFYVLTAAVVGAVAS